MNEFWFALRWLRDSILNVAMVASRMDSDDRVRWAWTLLTAFGTPYALWNLREVLVDNWSLMRGDPHAQDIYSVWAASDVSDQFLIFLALVMECVGGIFAITGNPIGALSGLFLSALALVWLTFTHNRQRHQINSMINELPIPPAHPTYDEE